MSNTITLSSFAENIFRARDTVARELVGFLPAVMINSDAEGVSINGTITSLRTRQPTLNTSYTPSMTIPAGDDQTIDSDTIQLDQVANVKIPITGETEKKLRNTGGQQTIDDMFAQALRVIVNAIEVHLGTVAKNGASRAIGTAGTTPFATNFNSIADVRKILADNGTPMDDGQLALVLNTAAGATLRQLSNLYKANEAGGDELLRQGVLLNLLGFNIRESAGVASHTKGTGAGYLANGAVTYASGSETTDIVVDTGTGTILAGDVVTYAADTTNKYVVGTALGAVANQLSLNRPGILVTVPDNNALTVGNSYTGNMAFHRNAIELAMRPPAMPEGGDAATERMTIFDPRSKLVFQIAHYKGYGMGLFDITVFYKAKAWKPNFIATLLG